MMNHIKQKESLLSYDHPLLSEFEPSWQPYLNQISHKIYQRGDRLIHTGDKASALWLIISGWVKHVRQTLDGKEAIVALGKKGEIFGENGLLEARVHPYSVVVLSEYAEFIVVPADVVREILFHKHDLTRAITRALIKQNTETSLLLEHMSTMTTTQRLGCFFLSLCKFSNTKSAKFELPINKLELALYLGMKPETLSRSQKQLIDYGVHVNGQTVEIDDIYTIKGFVCKSCSKSYEF